MAQTGYLRASEVGASISGVRRNLEYLAVFIVLCLCIDWRILRNLWMAFLAALYLPVLLIREPWNDITFGLAANLVLGLLALLIAFGADLFIRAKKRLLRS